MKKPIKQRLKEWGVFLGITFATCFCIAMFSKHVAQFSSIIGPSMEPTYYNGDLVLISKLQYHGPEDIERNDVVVFFHEPSMMFLIKRVYGLPGDTVFIDEEGLIWINGSLTEDLYGEGFTSAGAAATEITLGEDEFFVLGDNREYSEDSRSADVGAVSYENIIGQVTKKLFEK